MTPLRIFRRTLRLAPLAIALLLTGCVIVPPPHHHPGYRPVYVEPGPRHCRC